MSEPFNNIDKAFDVFYSDEVVVETSKGDRQTINCLVTSAINDEPISEDAIDTDRQVVDITFRRNDFCYAKGLKRGDKLTLFGDKVFRVVSSREDHLFGYIVTAREG